MKGRKWSSLKDLRRNTTFHYRMLTSTIILASLHNLAKYSDMNLCNKNFSVKFREQSMPLKNVCKGKPPVV